MAIYFLKKLVESRELWNLQDLICMAIYFLKKCFNLRTFGTLYLSLYILLKSWNNSRDLPYLWDFIYRAIYFLLKNCFTISRDLRDVGNLISISLDLTKNLKQFLGLLGPYIYGYLFFEKIV